MITILVRRLLLGIHIFSMIEAMLSSPIKPFTCDDNSVLSTIVLCVRCCACSAPGRLYVPSVGGWLGGMERWRGRRAGGGEGGGHRAWR